MIETDDRDPGEKESSESTEGAATDKTFKGSLMDTGLEAGESPSPHGTPGQAPSGTPPGHHFGWGKRKHQPPRPPSANATPFTTSTASANPTHARTGTRTP